MDIKQLLKEHISKELDKIESIVLNESIQSEQGGVGLNDLTYDMLYKSMIDSYNTPDAKLVINHMNNYTEWLDYMKAHYPNARVIKTGNKEFKVLEPKFNQWQQNYINNMVR